MDGPFSWLPRDGVRWCGDLTWVRGWDEYSEMIARSRGSDNVSGMTSREGMEIGADDFPFFFTECQVNRYSRVNPQHPTKATSLTLYGGIVVVSRGSQSVLQIRW